MRIIIKKTQKLSSGIIISQDYRDSVRFVFFETDYEEFKYATNGGTAFVISFCGKNYGLTCKHVMNGFEPDKLVITADKSPLKGGKIASIKAVCYPNSPTGMAVDTDILDLCVIEFSNDVDADFFSGAYILEANTTACTSKYANNLSVAGVLKDKSKIEYEPDVGEIHAGFCFLEFSDTGTYSSDPTLRQAIAKFDQANFGEITGISGSPVYDETANALCGMVVRGGMNGDNCNLYYLDIFDIIKLLECIHKGEFSAFYYKNQPI